MKADFLEPLEQARLLEKWARDGDEAATHYFGQKVTDRTHFLYERWRRASVEHGNLGKTVLNLLTFPRSYMQRITLSLRRSVKGSTGKVRRRAARDVAGVMVIGIMAGEAFKWVTGSVWNPYNPATLAIVSPGGLALGVPVIMSDTIGDISQAILYGDKKALSRALIGIKRSADLAIPFYEIAVDSFDVATGIENSDLYAMRVIREALNNEYKFNRDRQKVERDLWEGTRHILFGTKNIDEEEE